MMNQGIALLGALALCTGCAMSTTRLYEGSDAACVKGSIADPVTFFSKGAAHVSVLEVDGKGSGGETCVAPGTHRLGVRGYNSGQTAQDYIDAMLEGGHRYELTGHLEGISVHFQMWDITREPRAPVMEFAFKVTSISNPGTTVPIFIPKK